MWTNIRSLTGSLADGVLADTILIPTLPTNIRTGSGHRKKLAQTHLLVNEKGYVVMAKCFSKKYENKRYAVNNMQSERYVKMPVSARCYITSLPQEQTATNTYAFCGKHLNI